jgi:hypothetical protein
MQIITNNIQAYYRHDEDLYMKYNDKLYFVSERKGFHVHDVFIDLRDENFKIIETEQDLTSMSFIAPELYYILEETTIQN